MIIQCLKSPDSGGVPHAAYRRALNRACEAAGVKRFSPHKVRHAAAARFRREFGLDVTQKLLGHRHVAVSEIYAQGDEAMAVDAISKLG
ncbi:MAG: tyrosine-type recombinase/integrase [Candidatus Hydrogenedentota bacterium]